MNYQNENLTIALKVMGLESLYSMNYKRTSTIYMQTIDTGLVDLLGFFNLHCLVLVKLVLRLVIGKFHSMELPMSTGELFIAIISHCRYSWTISS